MRLAAPVHRLGRAADVMRAGHAQAAPRRQLAAARVPAGGPLHRVQTLRQAVGVDLQVVERAVRRLDQVGTAQRERVEPEPGRHFVEQRLDREAHVHRSVAAHRAARRQVGVDPVTAIAHSAHLVERVQQGAGVQDGDQAIAAVGSAALGHFRIQRRDRAAALQSDLEPDLGVGPAAMGEKHLFARQLQLYGAARGARQGRRDHLEVERLDAVAEAAADERLDDAHLRAVDAERLRQHQVKVVRNLADGVHGQAFALGLPVRQGGVEFDLAVRDLGAFIAAFEHQVGAGEAGFDIAELLLDLSLQVAGPVVVQQHRAFCPGLGRAEKGRQRIEHDLDRGQRGARRGFVAGGYGEQRFAAIAHLAARQRPFVLRDRNDAVRRAEFLARDHGADTGNRERTAGVDRADEGMGDRAATDQADQGLAHGQVGGVARPPGDFLDPVHQRRALADRMGGRRGRALQRGRVALHGPPPAAASTDSMILT